MNLEGDHLVPGKLSQKYFKVQNPKSILCSQNLVGIILGFVCSIFLG